MNDRQENPTDSTHVVYLMLRRAIPIVLGCSLFLIGCGGPEDEPNAPAGPTGQQEGKRPAESADDEPNTAIEPDDPVSDEPNDVLATDPNEIAEPNTPQVNPNEPNWEEGDFDKALNKVRALEEQARFSQAIREVFAMQKRFKGHPQTDELNAVLARLRDHREASPSVTFALKQLTSDVPTERFTAARTLRDAGETGLIYLRKTLRNDSGEQTVKAAQWLGEWHDDKALPIFVEILRNKPSDAMHTQITAALANWPDPLPADVLKGLLPLIRKDESFRQVKLADALAEAARTQANGQPAKFNELLDSNDAFATLKAYMEKAAKSDNPAAIAVAARYAGLMGLYQKGLRGEYYHGDSFDKRVMTRLDESINFPDGDGSQFKYPKGRKSEISIRWTGLLLVPEDGTYTLIAGSDDGKRIWIDGEKVLSDWTDQGMDRETTKLNLKAGLVPIKVEYYQGDGGAGIILKWKKPGADEEEFIGPENLRTRLADVPEDQDNGK